jgi:hypothetical protein
LLARQGYQFLNDRPLHKYEPQVSVAKIVALDRAGKLPALGRLRADDRYTVLARLELALIPTLIDGLTFDPALVRVGAVHGARALPVDGRPDCQAFAARAGATVQLLTHGGAAVAVLGDGPLQLHVARPDGRVRGLGVDPAPVLDPATEQVLNIGAIDAGAVVLTLPAGSLRLCGVTPTATS